MRCGIESSWIAFLLVLLVLVSEFRTFAVSISTDRPHVCAAFYGNGGAPAGMVSPMRTAEVREDDERVHYATRPGVGESGGTVKEGSEAEEEKLDNSWEMLRNILIAPRIHPSRAPRHQERPAHDGFRAPP
jgi:hypothetical protein